MNTPITRSPTAVSPQELHLMERYWSAANYLSVGQIYLLDNPLLHQTLAPEHIKPRLLGHWGTTPGLNFIYYVHLNRIIRARDANVIYICSPGHDGPGMVANTWLEKTYSEIYPAVPQNEDGMCQLFRQFSFPGGYPKPCGGGNAGLDQRRGRAGLFAGTRLWRGVR